MTIERQIQVLQQNSRVNTSQSMFGTQVYLNGAQINQHFGLLLENDASSIQGSEPVMTFEDGFNSQEKCDSS